MDKGQESRVQYSARQVCGLMVSSFQYCNLFFFNMYFSLHCLLLLKSIKFQIFQFSCHIVFKTAFQSLTTSVVGTLENC